MKSTDNMFIQLSDVVAGIFGKLFQYINTSDVRKIRKDIKALNDRQIRTLSLFAKMYFKSEEENKGFIHSLAPLKVMQRRDEFLLNFGNFSN